MSVLAESDLIYSASDHRECQPDLVNKYGRRTVAESDVCCELCYPNAESSQHLIHILLDGPVMQGQARSRIDTKYTPGAMEASLQRTLREPRRHRMIETVGEDVLAEVGLEVLMSDATCQRVLDCAHSGKVNTLEQLQRETPEWPQSDADCPRGSQRRIIGFLATCTGICVCIDTAWMCDGTDRPITCFAFGDKKSSAASLYMPSARS